MKNLFYTLLLFPLFAFSQLSFDGVVKDKLTGTELEKALVTVKPRRVSGAGFYSGVYTKADGAFEVTTSFDYPLEIIITKKGCERRVIKIKKGDKVRVIAGSNKGSEGVVAKVLREKNKAIVEGVNLVKKHAKPSAENPQGGIQEMEAPMQISNLTLLTADGQATRVGYRMEGDQKVRFSKKSNEVI